jgi:hypothetical protein
MTPTYLPGMQPTVQPELAVIDMLKQLPCILLTWVCCLCL